MAVIFQFDAIKPLQKKTVQQDGLESQLFLTYQGVSTNWIVVGNSWVVMHILKLRMSGYAEYSKILQKGFYLADLVLVIY